MTNTIPLCGRRRGLSAARRQATPYLERADLAAAMVGRDAEQAITERLYALECIAVRLPREAAAEVERTRQQLHRAVELAVGRAYGGWLASTPPGYGDGAA